MIGKGEAHTASPFRVSVFASIAAVRARVLLVLASLTTVGCGGAAIGPEVTLRATASELRAAAAEAEPADASPTHRTNAERRELADALDAARLERRALVTLPGAEGNTRSVVLVEEEGGMRVEAGVLGIPALDTPERAIAALHRALARELSLGSGVLLMETERLAWIEELTRYRDGTASPESLDVRVEGDRASTVTPLGDRIILVREGAEWRIASMQADGLE